MTASRIDRFLAAAGWSDAARRALAGDASARAYVRLARGTARAILMDVPVETGLKVAPFLAVTAWLRGLGLSAPEIYAEDAEAGLVLLEDLGDDLYIRLAEDSEREALLYGAAIDLIVDLQAAGPPPGGPGWTPPPYDRAVLLREMRLATEWYLGGAGAAPSVDLVAEFDALVEPIIAIAEAGRRVPTLRDYHSENLLWLPGRAGPARVGLLDYQDLLVGHAAYDVVSLLEDARRDVSPALRAAMIDRYLARSGADRADFLRAAHALGAQRNLKILGLFVRLARRDAKPSYMRHLPRVWAHLTEDLAHPDLGGLAAWVRRRLPAPGALAPAPT